MIFLFFFNYVEKIKRVNFFKSQYIFSPLLDFLALSFFSPQAKKKTKKKPMSSSSNPQDLFERARKRPAFKVLSTSGIFVHRTPDTSQPFVQSAIDPRFVNDDERRKIRVTQSVAFSVVDPFDELDTTSLWPSEPADGILHPSVSKLGLLSAMWSEPRSIPAEPVMSRDDTILAYELINKAPNFVAEVRLTEMIELNLFSFNHLKDGELLSSAFVEYYMSVLDLLYGKSTGISYLGSGAIDNSRRYTDPTDGQKKQFIQDMKTPGTAARRFFDNPKGRLVFPINTPMHWVLIDWHRETNEVVVIDSLSNVRDGYVIRYKDLQEPMPYIPFMVRKLVLAIAVGGGVSLEEFPLPVRFVWKNPKKQEDECSCGILALLNARKIATGIDYSLKGTQTGTINKYRPYLLMEAIRQRIPLYPL